MRSNIMIVDALSMRSSFLRDFLAELGHVAQFATPHQALQAMARGLSVDVAVVADSHVAPELIRALNRRQSRILGFGNQHRAPAGIERYLVEPILACDVYKAVKEIGARCKHRKHGFRS